MESWLTTATMGISAHFLYFMLAIGAIILFVAIYAAITPYPEITLIRAGNTAAAVSLGGAILGYTIPLAQAVAQSGSLPDMLIWSAVALVAQLLAFVVTRLTLPRLVTDVVEGKLASGVFLAAISIAIGMLNAAAMTD